jgi:hypothetical protein
VGATGKRERERERTKVKQYFRMYGCYPVQKQFRAYYFPENNYISNFMQTENFLK